MTTKGGDVSGIIWMLKQVQHDGWGDG